MLKTSLTVYDAVHHQKKKNGGGPLRMFSQTGLLTLTFKLKLVWEPSGFVFLSSIKPEWEFI